MGSSVLLLMVVQQLVAILVLRQEEMSSRLELILVFTNFCLLLIFRRNVFFIFKFYY